MSLETNKAVVQGFFEASSAADVATMVSYWWPDAINHGRFNDAAPNQQMPPAGLEGLRRVFASLVTAFPDRQWQIDDLLAVDDKVICRLTVSGTHQGVPDVPVEGGLLLKLTPPTGQPYNVQHIHIFRLADGKIAEHWAARDDLGLLEQIGALHAPRPA